jgi:ribosome maturation factor RimP
MPVANKELEDKLTELGIESAHGTGIEIAEVQVRGVGKARLVRVYIDKPAGVTHGDCELISSRLGERLDQLDLLPDDSYTLEVSSLGVERKLSKPRDFERVIGQKVFVSVRDAEPGAQQFEGKLLAVDGGVLEIEAPGGSPARVPIDKVQRAKLRFDW